MRGQILLGALFSTFALASPAIDPLTVTSLTPAQVSAYDAAQLPLLSSFGPAISSLAMVIATNTAALDALNNLNDQLTAVSVPTGRAALSTLNSLIDTLPTDVQPVYRSLISAEVTLLSSVVNDGKAGATGSAGGSGSANAAPTSGFVKAAGVAAGAFVAGVAFL